MAWSWGADPLTGVLNVAGSAIGDSIYNVASGQNSWSNTSNAWNTYMNGGKKTTTPTTTTQKKGSTGSTGSGNGTDYAAELKKALADLAAASRPYVPKPEVIRSFKYDTNQGLAKAQEMASNALNPVYQQAMTNFLNRQQTELNNKQAQVGLEREGLDQTFNRTLEDSATARQRDTEDTQSNIAEIGAARAVAAREEGLDFDSANRMLTEGVGAAGMADSGLGQQQVDDAQGKMMRASNEEVRQSDNKVAAANTLLNRSFEDLARRDTRAGEDKTFGNKKLDIDINNFITGQEADKTDFTFQQDKEKAQYLASMTKNYQDLLVSQWIQSLYGQGASAAEIQLASNTYR